MSHPVCVHVRGGLADNPNASGIQVRERQLCSTKSLSVHTPHVLRFAFRSPTVRSSSSSSAKAFQEIIGATYLSVVFTWARIVCCSLAGEPAYSQEFDRFCCLCCSSTATRRNPLVPEGVCSAVLSFRQQ